MIDIATAKTRTIRKVRTTRGEPLVVQLVPEGIYFREPGRRTRYLIPFGVAFLKAVQLSVPAKPKARRRSVRLSNRGA